MRRKIIKTTPDTLPRKSVPGHLECGHLLPVREGQQTADCRQCDRAATAKK
ncbi:hypothetical protein [Desulfosarcina ovata]|uniref:hypothetical protein n=1 Tax=Desulfosarcina ovata TaxID=83564 RepID=UPI001E497C4C|nr:hypothetical protein [Desulfosarcina ovata]